MFIDFVIARPGIQGTTAFIYGPLQRSRLRVAHASQMKPQQRIRNRCGVLTIISMEDCFDVVAAWIAASMVDGASAAAREQHSFEWYRSVCVVVLFAIVFYFLLFPICVWVSGGPRQYWLLTFGSRSRRLYVTSAPLGFPNPNQPNDLFLEPNRNVR